MTKISRALLGIMLSTQAPLFAGCQENNFMSKLSGAYIGIQAGITQSWGRFNTIFNDGAQDPFNVSGFARQTDALIGVLFGYRQLIKNDFTLGINVAVNYTNYTRLKKTFGYGPDGTTLNYLDANLQKLFTVIPSLTLGKKIAPRLQAFIGMGIGISGFRASAYDYASTTTKQSNITKVGFVPSVGLEYSINPKLSLIGNINFELYPQVNKTFDRTLTPLGSNENSYSMAIRPRSSSAQIGLIYKF